MNGGGGGGGNSISISINISIGSGLDGMGGRAGQGVVGYYSRGNMAIIVRCSCAACRCSRRGDTYPGHGGTRGRARGVGAGAGADGECSIGDGLLALRRKTPLLASQGLTKGRGVKRNTEEQRAKDQGKRRVR